MSESPFRLLHQLSSGPDGVSYAGLDERDQTSVQVARVFLAQRQPSRWRHVCARIALAGHIRHPQVVASRAWQQDCPDPHLVTDLYERSLSELLGNVDRDRAVWIVAELAGALNEAHRLGVTHGSLRPSRVALDRHGTPKLDLFDLRMSDASADGEDAYLQNGASDHPQAADVYALGVLCAALLDGKPPAPHLEEHAVTQIADAGSRLDALLHEMLAPNPESRPSMQEVLARLRRADAARLFTRVSPGESAKPPAPPLPERTVTVGSRLGRYQLKELIGEGGMGKVFRAEDVAGGEVALKVLHPRLSQVRESFQRFYREARLLSQLDNPHIARFIEANEDDGIHFLAMELVTGTSLHAVLESETRLEPAPALSIVRDVALALADVHDLGVVHRDIKPGNILLVGEGEARRAKLCDFGIAREVAPDRDHELTEAGLTVGTPHYMSPEQCIGAEVSAASDVYALGITLFKMLAGYVPFNAPDARAIVYKHLAEPVPDLRTAAPELSEGGARLVGRMLAKTPEERIANARALLEELEPVRIGDKTSIAVHPRRPESSSSVITYDFEWQLSNSPSDLWPHVSHTERLNRAIGLGAIDFTRRLDDRGLVETRGKIRLSGLLLDWREHPYEWVAPTRMGVLREFDAGPFVWLRSSVELVPRGGGTVLRHQIQVEPRGMIGKAAAAMEVGYKARKNLERVYRRIDEFLDQHRQASSRRGEGSRKSAQRIPITDAFEEPPKLDRAAAQRIDNIERDLAQLVDHRIAHALAEFVRLAPDQEVARVRPRAFARRHELDYRAVLRACLQGVRLGLFSLLWDVICPRCKVASSIVETLAALREHSHCDACDLRFDVDFGHSVEIIFRAHPTLRQVETGIFCIGGPGHTPHVLVQIRLDPGERFEVDLMLDEGHYRVVGRQLPMTWGFTVRRGAPLRQWELSVRDGVPPATQRVIDAGRQRIVLCNDYDREIVARIEREGERDDAMSAAEVATTAAFRELFPQEVLSPGHLVSIGQVTILVADGNVWSGNEEPEAFARLTELSRVVTAEVEAAGGAVVKIHGDGVMAAFSSPSDATTAALRLIEPRPEFPQGWGVRIAVHTGPALATSINDRLDYFGRVVRQADDLLRAAAPGNAVVSETTYADPEVAEILLRCPGPLGLVTMEEVVGQVLSGSQPPPPPE